MSSDYKDP